MAAQRKGSGLTTVKRGRTNMHRSKGVSSHRWRESILTVLNARREEGGGRKINAAHPRTIFVVSFVEVKQRRRQVPARLHEVLVCDCAKALQQCKPD
jgi:hypothetical protein